MFGRVGLAALLLVSACGTGPEKRWLETPVTGESIVGLSRGESELTLADGSVFYVRDMHRFGDVLCDYYACVRPAEIRRIREADWHSPSDSPALAIVFAPVTVAVWTAMWAAQAAHDNRGSGTYTPPSAPAASSSPAAVAPLAAPPAPTPTPLRPEPQAASPTPNNIWIKTGSVDGPVRGATPTNPCHGYLPQDIKTDREGMHWVHDHRREIHEPKCLFVTAYGLRKLKGADDLERSLRVMTFARVKDGWANAHCAGTEHIRRIVPDEEYADASVSPFVVITETLQDDAAYALPAGHEGWCHNGPSDPGAVPDRAAFVAAVDPFSRPKAAPWIRDRREDDLF